MMPESGLFPSFTIVVAAEDEAVAPSVVHNESEAVVFSGFHPVANVGTPVEAVFRAHVGENYVLLVPGLATVHRTEVDDGIVDTFSTRNAGGGTVSSISSGDDVDDVAVL